MLLVATLLFARLSLAGFIPGQEQTAIEGAAGFGEYIIDLGKHCGGAYIETLEDGTPYGYAPPDEDKVVCEVKCTEDSRCNGFVWRQSDKSCFWRKDVSATTLYPLQGHDCHYLGYEGSLEPTWEGGTITWTVEMCCMGETQCNDAGVSLAQQLGVNPWQVEVNCGTTYGRRRSEEPGIVRVTFTIKSSNGDQTDTILGKLKDPAVVEDIGEQIASDLGVTIESIETIGEITHTPAAAPSPSGGSGVCDIAPGELQPNGKPCTATCCRNKGSCVYNFDTKECFESPGDDCLTDDAGKVCLGPCCEAKGDPCDFIGVVRQCMHKDAMNPCTIKPGFLLPNGRPCRQECCIRRNLDENGEGEGCIWNHEEETCSLPRPADPCVDRAPGKPCLGPCCRGRAAEGCSWDPHSRQCLSLGQGSGEGF